MVIGKIPGYNSAINGNSNINYQNRLLNNLTVTNFSPIGYSIDFFGSDSVYKIGKDLKATNSTMVEQNFSKFGPSFLTENLKLGSIGTYSALNQWMEMQSGIGIKNDNRIESFKIVSTNDSTIMETLSNQYIDNYAETLASKITNNNMLSGLATGFTKIMPSIDSGVALNILSKASTIGRDNFGDYGQAASMLFGKMIGIQSAFPKIWDRSNYNNTSSLTVKLVSPSGNPEDIERYVIDPLRFLILAASPVTFDGITYGFPPLWKVEAKGMITMNLAGISALSISRGGPDTIFNYKNMPTNIDVRLVVEPVVSGFATPMIPNLDDDPNSETGSTKMIVQHPKSILNTMGKKSNLDESIELKPLILN